MALSRTVGELADTLLSIVRTRIELFSLEAGEEKSRLAALAGLLCAGLFFLAYQRSPEQFVTLQRKLSTDLMNEYIRHVGSGVWAIPPGAREGSYVGAGLFA